MKLVFYIEFIFSFLIINLQYSFGQNSGLNEKEIFRITSLSENQIFALAGTGWGYNYDSLMNDIKIWKQNPYIKYDSIGSSVQGRAIWELTITSPSGTKKNRIWLHARTHPNETQGWWVTKEIINILTSDSETGKQLRNNYIFNIIPMYNPDGVELGYERENAHKIDIESNWNSANPEPEVLALKKEFVRHMNSGLPLRIMLNMHSAYACKRYFVYHHEKGSSLAYSNDEKDFIAKIRKYFISGIEDWNYYISWTNSPGLQYPEGWFWTNYREKVMALTYEDMNCTPAGEYYKTANAILKGISDYLNIPEVKSEKLSENQKYQLNQNYPNPFNSETRFSITLPENSDVQITIYNNIGQEITTLFSGLLNKGEYTFGFSSQNLPSGVYMYRMTANKFSQSRKMVIVK